jgi:hypothetical protein
MRVDRINGMQDGILNVHYWNKNVEQRISAPKKERQEQKDTISISPLGKTGHLAEALMEQKQKIIENKNELIGRTLEKGEDMESIKSQLESFETQLNDIDTQIAQITAEYAKQKADKLKGKEITYEADEKGKEAGDELANSVISLSSSLNQTQMVSSVKTRIDGEARILKTEIKLDNSRRGASALKKDRLTDLQKQSAHIAGKIKEGLAEIKEKIEDNNKKDYDNGDLPAETEKL